MSESIVVEDEGVSCSGLLVEVLPPDWRSGAAVAGPRHGPLAASIDHPNVITIYEAGEAEGQFYIAMRFVDGPDLRRLIDEEGALEPTRGGGPRRPSRRWT